MVSCCVSSYINPPCEDKQVKLDFEYVCVEIFPLKPKVEVTLQRGGLQSLKTGQ